MPDRPMLIVEDDVADEPFSLYDQGLQADVVTLIDRRRFIKGLGTAGLAAGLFSIVGCGPGGGGGGSASASANATAVGGASASASGATGEECAAIPEETAGPFPGDGSNGPDMLSQSGIVRQDITTSFGTSTTKATGVPLTIKLALQDVAADCGPLAGAAVYLWHCDQAGRYSLYSQGVEGENYLRGVQEAGEDGIVTFTSIFPACYPGRWPHVHFEVYPSLDAATDEHNRIATSQIALPEDISNAVYATSGYEQSVQNMQRVSLERDNVFGEDAGVRQVGTMDGTVDSGLTVTLAVPVSA
jgi:protocatechuate 3,4-dioxygenase beta subunit